MGGCIGCIGASPVNISVSSLHGRVYRLYRLLCYLNGGFLPTWEGVSPGCRGGCSCRLFPPYMGGCIGVRKSCSIIGRVSSLHGRVYHRLLLSHQSSPCFLPTWEGVSPFIRSVETPPQFPPYMGGCIENCRSFTQWVNVSSLHGRVYHRGADLICHFTGFLPTWEGVSHGRPRVVDILKFPPYMGGCITSAWE